MRAGDVSGGSAQLHKAVQRLEVAWQQTQEHWHDENSRVFEKEQILPLLHMMKITVESTQLYSTVIHQAKMACDPEARERLSG